MTAARPLKMKDAASAGTDPRLGSPNFPGGKIMNAHTNIPSVPPAKDPRGPMTFNVDMPALRRMRQEDLWHAMDAINATWGALSAYMCQPRYHADDEGHRTPAGAYLETLMEVLDSVKDGIRLAAEDAKPTEPTEIEFRAYIRIWALAASADDLHQISAVAAEAIRDGRAAEFEARRVEFDRNRRAAK